MVTEHPASDAVLSQAVAVVHEQIAHQQADNALRVARRLSELFPNRAEAWTALGQSLRAAGRVGEADEAQRTAIALRAATLADLGPAPSLRARIRHFKGIVFLGGPPDQFVEVGQRQLMTLLSDGLEPEHRVLDVGCGCLRAGVWIMRYLRPGGYRGIEPNRLMLGFGRQHVAGEQLLERAQPRFDHNDRFELDVFGERFDRVLARSIWTHASREQIEAMLDGFVAVANPGAAFLTSYLPATEHHPSYQGEGWVGRSHESPVGGLVTHDLPWIEAACAERGLVVAELDEPAINGQVWLRVSADRAG